MLLPASTNAQYAGARASAWFLALLAVFSLIPGAIHYFAPDGGAGSIAGLDMGSHRRMIVAVFAWVGATQIPYGLAQLAVALRYRTLVPLFLLLALIERALGALAAWVTRSADAAHHPPNHYAVVIALPLILLFLLLSLRKRPA
jgi:hypothetical protein